VTTFHTPQAALDYLASLVDGGGAGVAEEQRYLMSSATILVNGIGASVSGEQVTIPGSDTTGGSAVDPNDPNVLVLEWEIRGPDGNVLTDPLDETPGFQGYFRGGVDVAEAIVPSGTDLNVYTYLKGQSANSNGAQAVGYGWQFGVNADADLVDVHPVIRSSSAVWSLGAAETGLPFDRTVGENMAISTLGYHINRRTRGTRERPRLNGFVRSTERMRDTGGIFVANFEHVSTMELNDDAAAPTVPRLRMAFFRRTGATGDVVVAPDLYSNIMEYVYV
jgi:hypothetical protein